ncbi:MAG: hypothetical protein ABL927_10070 [Bdellovibrionales bacterium]
MKKLVLSIMLITNLMFTYNQSAQASLVTPATSVGLTMFYRYMGIAMLGSAFLPILDPGKSDMGLIAGLSVSFALMGIIFLNSGNTIHDLEYTILTSEDARNIGVTEDEVAEYNSNLDQINLTKENILQIAQSDKNEEQKIIEAREAWQASGVSPIALDIARLLTSQLITQN